MFLIHRRILNQEAESIVNHVQIYINQYYRYSVPHREHHLFAVCRQISECRTGKCEGHAEYINGTVAKVHSFQYQTWWYIQLQLSFKEFNEPVTTNSATFEIIAALMLCRRVSDYSWTALPLNMKTPRYRDLSKRREPLTERHSIAFQKALILSDTEFEMSLRTR